jgi:hypothetical protein
VVILDLSHWQNNKSLIIEGDEAKEVLWGKAINEL